MYTLKVKNKYGQMLELSHNKAYAITSIDGLDPPDATINTTKNVNSDGSVFNSSYLNDRQIIITMAINSPAELNRIALYKFFKSKMPLTLYYKNSTRNVYIDGYVSNFDVQYFEIKQIVQITITCPNPYFVDVEGNEKRVSGIINKFEFPFSVEKTKNLLPIENGSKTINGITWTVNNDGTLIANGTATAQSDFEIGTVYGVFDGPEYVLSGCPYGGSEYTYNLFMHDSDYYYNYIDYGNPVLLENLYNTVSYKVVASVMQGQTVENLVFKPMINAGNAAGQFEMYGKYYIEFSELTTEPIEVVNNSDVETGAMITIQAVETIVNPTVYNAATGKHMTIHATLNNGDAIRINTVNKEKSATLIRADGTTSNAIGLIAAGSEWIKLIPGSNYVQLLSGGTFSDAGVILLDFNTLYEGV